MNKLRQFMFSNTAPFCYCPHLCFHGSAGEGDDGETSGSDVYGDFEDLETGEAHTADAAVGAARKAIQDVAAEERRDKKRAKKALFDTEVHRCPSLLQETFSQILFCFMLHSIAACNRGR